MTIAERHRKEHFRSKLEAQEHKPAIRHHIDTETFRCTGCRAPMCFTCGGCFAMCDCGKNKSKETK